MCSLTVSLQSNIIPKYFNLLTCGIILFKYTATSFCSFRFLLVINIPFDFSSLNLILLSFAQVDILSISMLVLFSATPTDSAFIIIKISSANATTFMCLEYCNFRRLNWMFHNPGLQHDPCGQLFIMLFSLLRLFIAILCGVFTKLHGSSHN